ncbi:hypothetical protein GCM10017581_076460 [Dactylosporangium matsuzakiense]|uniref:Uncharacterized protein n=1 Tax=Dactylosporangium matsuzakiense TaxID=53360 RepID=A0A9W6KRG1_9ACTN|nr:hypothetical protein GCM10017581_076460 [Dactylosporangium matsuzakiense]
MPDWDTAGVRSGGSNGSDGRPPLDPVVDVAVEFTRPGYSEPPDPARQSLRPVETGTRPVPAEPTVTGEGRKPLTTR